MRAALLLGDEVVAQIDRDESCNHQVQFARTYRYQRRRPWLGVQFEERDCRDFTASGLPNFLAHLLPEGAFLGAVARAIGVDTSDHLEILCALGVDLPGAVRVVQEAEFDGAELAAPVQALARQGLRFSLAGVQPKMSEGSTPRTLRADHEGRPCIVKLGTGDYPGITYVEHATMSWARRSGIDVPWFGLAPVSAFPQIPAGWIATDEPVFVIERFDRGPGTTRTHIEDFAQVLDVPWGGPGKYTGRFERMPIVLHALGDLLGVVEFVRRLVHVVISGNSDAHLKNWSLRYEVPHLPRLAPAYDLVSTVAWPRLQRNLNLSIGGTSDFDAVERTHFTGLAPLVGGETALRVLLDQAIERTWDTYDRSEYAQHLAGGQLASLDQHLARVRLR